jgi:hypothetical protein
MAASVRSTQHFAYAVTLTFCLSGCVGSVPPATTVAPPNPPASYTKRIQHDGRGGFILPDGIRVPDDGRAGLTLPNGTHLLPDRLGNLALPNGAVCVPDGVGGYLCP